jgi:hypothetical protein
MVQISVCRGEKAGRPRPQRLGLFDADRRRRKMLGRSLDRAEAFALAYYAWDDHCDDLERLIIRQPLFLFFFSHGDALRARRRCGPADGLAPWQAE